MTRTSDSLARRLFQAVLASQLVVLAGAFVSLDILLARQIDVDLARQAADQLRLVGAIVAHHDDRGLQGVVSELRELEELSGVLAQMRRDAELVFSSKRLAAVNAPVVTGNIAGADGSDFVVAVTTVPPYSIAAAVPRAPAELILQRLRAIMGVCFILGMAAAAGVARWLAAKSVGPLERLTTTAGGIDLHRLGHRIADDPSAYDEVRRLAASFNEMLVRLDDAVGRLRQFIADASHELRTPVAVLKVTAQAVSSERTASADRVALARDQLGAIDRLHHLIDDLLLLSSIDAGKMDHDHIDVNDVVIESAERLRPLADTRGVALQVNLAAAVRLGGDRRQLERLVTNLIDNAIKFTPPAGRVDVTLTTGGGHATIAVADTGIGIDPAEQAVVFDPFVRADESRSRDSGGAGLGLAIARRVCLAHGGRLDVESALGHGATFRAVLPVKTPPSS